MQWPPTSPGENLRKFHLVPAASRTSRVEIFMASQMIAISFISAMLRSRWVFSSALAASATLIDGALWMPAVTTVPYSLATFSAVAASSPAVTFTMRSKLCSLSPGLMRSGE